MSQTGAGLTPSADDGLGLSGEAPATGGAGEQRGDSSGVPSGGPAAAPDGNTVAIGQPATAGSAATGPPAVPKTGGAVKIGFIVQGDSSSFAGSLGSAALGTSDEGPMLKAMVDSVNARGGIGGRRIEPVTYKIDPATNDTYASLMSAACAKFTQDHRVMAVLTAFHNLDGKTLPHCLQKAGVATIIPSGNYTGFSRADYRQMSDLYTPGAVPVEVQLRSLAEGLLDGGFFAGGKVGLVAVDEPQFRTAIKDVLEPTLARDGVKIEETAFYEPIRQTSDTGAVSNAMTNAVVKFRSRGIDRVIFAEYYAAASQLFPAAAKNQGYTPRYGLTSVEAPDVLADNGGQELIGSQAVGWLPEQDLDPAERSRFMPRAASCDDVMRKAGVPLDKPADAPVARQYCEQLWFLEAAVNASGGEPSLTALRAGVARLGTNYQPVRYLASDFRVGHWGTSAVRRLVYVGDCRCFRYTGPTSPAR